jgi:hypothetical protein
MELNIIWYETSKYWYFYDPFISIYFRSAGQEITRLFWKPNFHCPVHKRPLLVQSQTRSPHLTTCFNTQFNVLLGLSGNLFPLKFKMKCCICNACCMSITSHPPWFDHPNKICEEHRLRVLCFPFLLTVPLSYVQIPSGLSVLNHRQSVLFAPAYQLKWYRVVGR